VPPPEGVTAQVMPVEEGLDALAKEIMAGGRTYAVFDLAKMVMGARERFNVGFRSKGERRFFKCRKDGSVWLTKTEAVSHFWASEWRKDFYEEVATKTDPPKGNFQQVAKCGMSGEILGPPNYHAYQTEIARMHRERFAHMSLNAYRSKIRMERDEEAVNAWMEKMSQRIEYRPTGGKPRVVKTAEQDAPAADLPAAEMPATAEGEDASAEEAVEEAPVTEEAPAAAQETPAAEEEAPLEEDHSLAESLGVAPAPEPAPEPEPEAEPEPAEQSAAEAETPDVEEEDGEPAPLLPDAKAVEEHFLEHHFKDAYYQVERAWVSGGIPGNQLSPGLLTLLREVVAEERRYPSRLTPMLCRQLSGRHVAVFKWRKKLKAGPSRPHSIPTDIVLADRPQTLLEWLVANSGKNLDDLWKSVLPEDADDATKHAWYHDLHWVLNQGYGLLLDNGVLHLAKGEEGVPARKAAKKAVKKSARKDARSKGVGTAPRGTAGLYAISGRTLAGEPKSVEGLCGRGLWPQPGRLIAEEVEEDDEPRDPLLG
jgi:hypothetical protein